MDPLIAIIIVVVLLLLCVGGITVIQKKEQAKALLRQKVATFRFRAGETSRVLENFSNIPIGTEARDLLLQYIELNLAEANQLAPSDQSIAKNLTHVKQRRQNPQSNIDKKRLIIPHDTEKLNLLIKNLSKLGKYLLKFKVISAMNVRNISIAINKITFLISEAKICAYIQQGQRLLAAQNHVNAQRLFQTAQKMLDRFKNKDARLIALESELKELLNLTPVQVVKEKPLVAVNENETPHNDKTEQDSIFGPKKKW